MKDKIVCVSSLLCYNKSKFNSFLAFGISEFLIENYFLDSYSIELNYGDENNIRFLLFCSENNIEGLKNNFKFSYRNWLRQGYVSITDRLSENRLFEKENSSLFEIDNQLKITSEDREYYNFSKNLSQIILDVLKDDMIDDQTILTFAFYLRIGLVKVAKLIDPEFNISFKNSFSFPTSVHSESNQKVNCLPIESFSERINGQEEAIINFVTEKIIMHKKFENNKKKLLEIKSDIMDAVLEESSSEWIQRWMVLCKNILNESFKNGNKSTSFRKIIDSINRHLGIKPEINDTLSYFIERVFNLMNPPGAIIMGAQKCGTSTLHHTLVAHSNIQGPVVPGQNTSKKEINFFFNSYNWNKGIEWYFSHFVGLKDIFLDSSPNYLIAPFCYKQMLNVVPNAKLII